MSVGFIMYEIVDKDSLKYQGINTLQCVDNLLLTVGYSLKNQGINTTSIHYPKDNQVGYSLKYQGINTSADATLIMHLLDIHLNIKVLTPCRAEYDEFQPFITKIK